MCYSAMVEQDVKRLARKFGAEVNVEAFAELFARRANGEKLPINKAMELAFLTDEKSVKSMKEKSIAKSIRSWHESEIERLKSEINKQTDRLEKAKESLKKKETKKALEDVRIAGNKISKCNFDLTKHESEKIESESEERIFPLHYASILYVSEAGEKLIMPMRYHMRPHDEEESFDRTHDGCYNARFNNLTRVPFWNDSLIKGRRGIMVVKKFYENVPTQNYYKNKKLPSKLVERENIVVRFEPKGVTEMYVPILWDSWQKKGQSTLYSMALITDDPPPEVQAAGHDRCPIFLKKSAVDSWLINDEVSGKILRDEILSQRETPYYEHEVLGVA